MPAEYPAFEEASPTFGRVFAWGLVGCRGWPPARGRDQPLDDRRRRRAPIVVVGTTRDPATPLVWAAGAGLPARLRRCSSTRDGDGHTGYNSGNDCVDDAVESYLIEGKVPATA